MVNTVCGRTLRWRDGDNQELLDAVTESDVIGAMRRRSEYGDLKNDAAYMHAIAARFRELDGVTVRVDNMANFVADAVAVGHVEAVWIDAHGHTTRIPPDSYRLARLCLCSTQVAPLPQDMHSGMGGRVPPAAVEKR